MEGTQDFGGINISYLNPTRADVSLNMSVLDDDGNLVLENPFTQVKRTAHTALEVMILFQRHL